MARSHVVLARSSCKNNDAAKHHGNAHLVRETTKKKKQDKEAFDDIQNQKSMEATMVEKAKVWYLIFIASICIFFVAIHL